jgi:hypothetical protein
VHAILEGKKEHKWSLTALKGWISW